MGGIPAGRAGALAAAVVASLVVLAPAAHGDDQVTVRGTDFPSPGEASLSFVGCAAPYDRTPEVLAPYISRGNAPVGERSLGYDLAGGNAVGSMHVVASLRTTSTASLDVHAPDGATGVAYAGYQDPADKGTELLWFGRAELTAPAGEWTTIDAAKLTYTWAKYDTATGRVISTSAAPASVSSFLARRGDGPGLFTIGFGCDGNPFTMDALRVGSAGSVTTYDLEGLTSAISVREPLHAVTEGKAVTVHGAVRSSTGNRIPHATLILERQRPGERDWAQVRVADAAPDDASVTLEPKATARYRWRFVGRPAHEGSISEVFVVVVVPVIEETPSPTPSPSDEPTPSPSHSASASPSSTGSAEPSETRSASESPTAVESASASLTP